MINNPSRKGRLSRVSSFFHGNGDYVFLDREFRNNCFKRSMILFSMGKMQFRLEK